MTDARNASGSASAGTGTGPDPIRCPGVGSKPAEILAGNSTGVTGRCPVCRRSVTVGRHNGLIGKHNARAVKEPSDLERALLKQLEWAGVPAPEREYIFSDGTSGQPWRFDLAWLCGPDRLHRPVAVEVQGGTWVGGRHGRGQGQQTDHTKLNAAQLAGWTVLQYTRKPIEDGTAVAQIRKALDLD